VATIRDIGLKIKTLWGQAKENLLLVAIIILVALLAFALGRLSVFYGEKGEFEVLYPSGQSASVIQGALALQNEALPPQLGAAGEYVASRTGTAYFFPWCPLALRIPAENRIYFPSRTAAEAAGYHGGRCNGL